MLVNMNGQKVSELIRKNAISNDISDPENELIVYYDKKFYHTEKADKIFDALVDQVEYDFNSRVVIFGKSIPIPRKQAGYGDIGTTYSFSGTTVRARPWIPILSDIKKDVEKATGKKFNFCLVNYYKNGSEYIGYHKDDERDLGDETMDCIIIIWTKTKILF